MLHAPVAQRDPGAAASVPGGGRDGFIDFVRGASILVVVAGHWLMAAVIRSPDGLPRADNVLAHVRWLQPLTWLLQVMPLFFFAAGFANALALRRAPAARLYTRRVARLVAPVLALAVTWLLLGQGLRAAGVADPVVHDVTQVASQPLWFLAVYLLLAAVAPAQLRIHRRHPLILMAALALLAGLMDVLRLTGLAPAAGVGNYLFVFMAAQEIGFWYAGGMLTRLPRSVLIATSAAALGSLIVATTVGPYPMSMVGVPGESMSNMSPPTACLLLVTIAQAGLVLAARPVLLRWLARPRAVRLTLGANSVALSVFLWHLSAFVAAAAALVWLSFPLPTPGSAMWWLGKPVWLAVAAACLAGVVAIARPAERWLHPSGNPVPFAFALTGLLLSAFGLAVLASIGFAHPFVARPGLLGMSATPAWGVVSLVVGTLLAVWPRALARR